MVETLFQDTKYWNRDSEIPGSNIPPPPSYEQSSQDVTGNFSYTNREHPWEKSPETGIFVPVVEEESPPLDQNERKSSFLTQYRRTVVSFEYLSKPIRDRVKIFGIFLNYVPHRFPISRVLQIDWYQNFQKIRSDSLRISSVYILYYTILYNL